MRTGIVSTIPKIGGGHYEVINRDMGIRIGQVDLSKPPMGVDHTTETELVPPDFSRGAPHFSVGRLKTGGRVQIVQLVPLGFLATALENDSGGIETNRYVRVQIEIVGRSQLHPWLPDKETCTALASVYEFCHKECGIPKQSVYPTTLKPGIVWATESNPHRRNGKFGKVAGWYGHVDVPENDHWDPGSLQRHQLFEWK